MTDINDIIKREVNPFDIEMKHLEFWADEEDSLLMVESIHKNAIIEIEELLDLVGQDHRSRTVLLEGESGSGKTYLLRRIKRSFNSKAFFAYILCDWPDSTHIWRHILRRTVDSLIQVPEGENESQLILWLKSLTAFTKRDIKQRIFNDSFWEALQSNRQKFIKHLKDSYKKASIYNPDMFFGVLHDLANPELYDLACEWLRGDDLNEDSMKEIKVKTCIDTEDAAKNILANFGRISTQTQPIVLCFDNLETMPQLPEGLLDIQPFLNVNTTIHGNNLKNFLVIISVITNNWNRHLDRIFLADKVGIHRKTRLKDITLEQAEALWNYHLKPLHQLANPSPESPIFPLNREMLEKNNPGSKTKPRNALTLGREEYQKYKLSLEDILPPPPPPDPTQAEFELLWQHEYTKSQGKITKISLLSSPDLIQMLQQSISSLKMQGVKTKLLSGKYASYSLSYQHPTKREKLGIVWTEDSNMTSFYHIMNACQTVLQKNLCQTMYLIRGGDLGKPNMAGNQLYRQIFTDTNHVHIKPSLQSIHYLATYQSLVNSAKSQELVIGGQTINLQRLETLINEYEILNQCTLLQDLGIVSKPNPKPNGKEGKDLRPVKNFLLNLVKTQAFMGVTTLISQAVSQFPDVKETDIQHLIDLLCQERKVKIMNPKAKLPDQLICLIA
ncbi:ATP-binding protein [Aphanizomenon flos-aquae NRERC-008]|uniref:ATP-binding protein n=1 Tax=Aphanizomenon flos-aquae FACHB-1249 TaxID=2692889 RepID=A0ABR8ITI6_APHFL|nr:MULTISPECIES: ATP-binding protein [Aphanizomenon]MBD2391692.1 ATP-binding protein [Aphanizomenon flos-aquae FACHB-1171]MBD2557961.1 ATP-binding protein [Aphanizomenon flos-aquae FACHB-1290]MBD2631803.1 ATP-binding protein [Aphanizomenon sp. FACHB-1399]MBD2642669.1 ATP-binding protein [Aphanizomenon sp. FACHB-1401]MBD2658168.1 ATP-binding protein [Aphanizomenon flos-aquae FACHB-1265]